MGKKLRIIVSIQVDEKGVKKGEEDVPYKSIILMVLTLSRITRTKRVPLIVHLVLPHPSPTRLFCRVVSTRLPCSKSEM